MIITQFWSVPREKYVQTVVNRIARREILFTVPGGLLKSGTLVHRGALDEINIMDGFQKRNLVSASRPLLYKLFRQLSIM